MKLEAQAYTVGHCDNPRCRSIHMYFHSDHYEMDAAIHIDKVPELIEVIKKAAYAVAALKEDKTYE